MATVAEVKDGALELLGVKAIGQTAKNKDTVRATKAYNEVYANLKTEGLAIWASTAAVPDDVAPHLEALMAFNAADAYGISGERYQRIIFRAQNAFPEIRIAVTPKFESLEEPDDF